MKGLNRSFLLGFIVFLVAIFSFGLISAATINDTLHVSVQTTFSNGTIQNGTFTFGFNITDNSSSLCGPNVIYNHSVSMATDSRGIASVYLPTSGSNGGNLSNLFYRNQYYLCYYRDGTLTDVAQFSRVPYSFRATQVNLSEVSVESNFSMGNFYAFLNRTGVLTTTPQNALNVVGDVNATTSVFSHGLNLTNVAQYFANSSLARTDTSNTFGNFNQTFNGTTLTVWSLTQRVGIGTTDPFGKLANYDSNVADSDSIGVLGSQALLWSSVNTSASGAGYVVAIENRIPAAVANRNALLVKTNASTSTSYIARFESGGTSKLTVRSDGMVGINTSTPQDTLNVLGSLNVTRSAAIYNSQGGTNVLTLYYPGGALPMMRFTGNTTEGASFSMRDLTDSVKINISTYGSSFINNSMLGINTSTPQNTLNVLGDFNATQGATISNTQGGNIFTGFSVSTGVPVFRIIGNSTLNTTLQIRDNNDNVRINLSVLDSYINGNRMGLNTTTPQNALNVIGATNSTTGFIVGANTGITANYSVGTCWIAFSGGIAYGSNCTAF